MKKYETPPPRDRKVTGFYGSGYYVIEWSQDKDSWTTCYDGAKVDAPQHWVEYVCFIVEYKGMRNKLVQHRYLFLSEALGMIEFMARTGVRITFYEE